MDHWPAQASVTPRLWRRGSALALVAGAAIFAALLGAQMAGYLGGWPLIVLGLLAALSVPTSQEASRRIFVTLCILLGMAPLASWLPLPIDGVTRVGIGAAVTTSAIAALVVSGRIKGSTLIPRFRPVDGLTLGAAAFATWSVSPLLAITDGQTALRALRLGWDYAAHFNMTEMIRRSGSLTELAAPGPFGEWAYGNYPKGFHAAAAALMDVTLGSDVVTPDAELVSFVHTTAGLGVAALTMVVAGVVSLPQARREVLLTAPLVALVTLAFTMGPGGGSLLQFGFPNFLIAVALLACIPLIVIPMERVAHVAPLLALSGVLIGIAHNWALLLGVAFAGVVPALLPARRKRWPHSLHQWTLIALVVAGTALAGLLAYFTLTSGTSSAGDDGSLFLMDGGFVGGSRMEILLSTVLAIVACLTVGWRFMGGVALPRQGSIMRTFALALCPLTGLALLGGLAAFQISQTGDLGYYFYKLGAGVQLASVVLFAAVVAILVPLIRRSSRPGILLTGTATGVLVMAATFSGVINPTSEAVSVRRPPGLDAREAWQDSQSPPEQADEQLPGELLVAASAAAAGVQHFWVPPSLDGSTAPRLSNQWLFALTGQWTEGSQRVVDGLWGDSVPLPDRPRRPADAVLLIHDADPQAVILVAPETFERLKGEPTFTDVEIVTW